MTVLYDVIFYGGLVAIAALLWWKRHSLRLEWWLLRQRWSRLRREHRAEQQQPDAGMSLLGAPTAPSSRRKRRRKPSFTEHVEQAMDVFRDDEELPDLIDAGRQMQNTDPADVMAIFKREGFQ